MPLTSYTLTIHVHDEPTLDILNKAPYRLRVGYPPKTALRDFEPAENKIPFTFLEDQGSNTALVLETAVSLIFTAQGWVYSIGYKLPGDDAETGLRDEKDITPGEIYTIPKTGDVEAPRPKDANDAFMTDKVFGVINGKTVEIAVHRRPKDAAAASSTLVEQYPAWFPGFGAITAPTDEGSSAPSSIYVWFETHIPGAQHEVTGVIVDLSTNPALELYVHSDGTIANTAETSAGATAVGIPASKTA